MPKTHGMGRGKGPRPKSKERWEEARTDDGTAARKLLVLSELVDPRKSKWKPVNKSNVQQIYDRFVLYLQFCELHDLIPFWIGFCNALGYDRVTLSRWFSGESPIPEECCNILKRIHDIFQQNIVDMQGKGEIRDIVGMFWLKALNPKFWAVEVTKNDISVTNINMGELPNSEQLAGKWLSTSNNAIECPSYKVLDIPDEKEKQETSQQQTYNEYIPEKP